MDDDSQDNKQQALRRFVEEHQAPLRGFVRLLGVHPDSVDDLAQETFLTAHRELDRFDESRDLGKWLRGIALNLVRNETRRKARLGTEFGIAIERDGEAKVQVFDGEVELYPPGRRDNSKKARKLFGGDGLVYNNSVAGQDLASIDPATFPSFENIERRRQSGAEKRFKLWRNWNEKLLDDSRVAFSYDFETEGSELLDRGPDSSNGTIIGAEWVGGRWPGKKALEFKRPSDRVRFDMPGSFDAMTVSVWLRLDALPNRSQGILLTDNYDPGRLHLALNPTGNLRMGIRTPTNSKRWKDGAAGYGTPELFTPRQIGVWSFVCSVYDRETGKVRMYFNGRQVADEDIIYDQPLEIGTCDLGNWTSTRGKVRNFVGRMDELTIWNSALSTEEIRQIYRRTRP